MCKYILVASSRALQNMRADVLNIEKLSNRFEVGEMRGREHIHHGKYGTTLSMYVVVNNRASLFQARGKYTQILKGMHDCISSKQPPPPPMSCVPSGPSLLSNSNTNQPTIL